MPALTLYFMLQIPENRPGGERVIPVSDQTFHVIPATSAFTKPESYLVHTFIPSMFYTTMTQIGFFI